MCPLTMPTSRPSPPADRNAESDLRAGLVIVSNSVTPYLVNLHRLVAAGIPELKLHTLITHGIGDFDWQVNVPSEIHATNVSSTGEHPLDNPLRRPLVEFRKASELIRYFKENKAGAVIINGYRYISYLRVMDYCYRRGIPFFVRNDSNILNEPELSFAQQTVKRAIYRWWMKRASGVFSMGALGDQFFLKYGADRSRIYRGPYWPDFDAFAACDQVELERFQRKFGLDSQRHYLMFSGRLVPVKRVDLIIDAFAAIADDRPEWDLLIVGDGMLREELRRRLPVALRPRVVWTGFLDGSEIRLAYHAAHVLVLPSDREPWAVVIQEAMAAGLVVVASNIVGAAYELVKNGQSGRIFPAGQLNELQQALWEVTSPESYPEFQRQSRAALTEYRQMVDPVKEIRRALADIGLFKTRIPHDSETQLAHG
jgi:glycosyltransferase involved in cell wall biosynthesis